MSTVRFLSRAGAASLIIGLYLVVGIRAGTARAQSALDYGARVSAVSSAVTDRLAGITDPLWGIAVAAYAQKTLTGPISARLEFAYNPRGVRQEVLGVAADGSSEKTGAKTRLHYLSVSALVTAGWSLGESPVTAYVLLGPRIDVLVGRESGTFSFPDEEVPADLADRYSTITLGASGGVGIGVNIGGVMITAEALQHRDITAPVDEGGTRTSLTLGPLRNVARAISLGVRW